MRAAARRSARLVQPKRPPLAPFLDGPVDQAAQRSTLTQLNHYRLYDLGQFRSVSGCGWGPEGPSTDYS